MLSFTVLLLVDVYA